MAPEAAERRAAAGHAGDESAERRRLVDMRCGFADRACLEADTAEARFTEVRRAYDARLRAVGQAEASLEPHAVRAAKEAAHRAFKVAVHGALTRPQVENAAVAWLDEINRINTNVRYLERNLERERSVAQALVPEVERLAAAAESSRYAADAAVEACHEARAALAAYLAERDAAPRRVPVDAAAPAANEPEPEVDDDLPLVDPAAPRQPIVRLLRGDRQGLADMVARLAGEDPVARSRWQILLSDLVDALNAAAIDMACFEFPAGHPFWSLFDREQARDVARSLAALGCRYDGLGEFGDGRVPGHRELTLAVGHAGLNPVRIRFWPNPTQAAELYRHVRIDTVGLVAERAPSLTLGEIVRLLGRRAEVLSDLLNEWSRLRPLLLVAS